MAVSLVVLIVLDGWGVTSSGPGNAITGAKTPNMNRFLAGFPHTTLAASMEAVGLPHGEAGNTETGHLNLGAGRIVYQDLLRIDMSVADGSFLKNTSFLKAIEHATEYNSNLHIMGLLSGGSVHASTEHLFALLRLCKEREFNRVFLHLFTDGRDSPPTAAEYYLALVEEMVRRTGVGQIASIMGRYWAMDRDFRWDRTEKAYRALTLGEGKFAESVRQAIEEAYKTGVTDEFLNPIVITKDNKPIALIKGNDSVIFYNFRIDRPRQLTRAFLLENFAEENEEAREFDPYAVKYHKKHLIDTSQGKVFTRGEKIKNLFFVTMTRYDNVTAKYASVAFPPVIIKLPLGGVLSSRNLRQLRLAESEKERFVTFYFNGQQEIIFPGEDRYIVPSPKVPTYDQKPEMSAFGITEHFLEVVNQYSGYSFVLINFANADMVGHTGNIGATKKACEVIDECLGKIVQRVNLLGGVTLITADHGNAEEMLTNSGGTHTEHTSNPVPFIAVGSAFLGKPDILQTGILADVAPTVLKILGINKPSEMTGRVLL